MRDYRWSLIAALLLGLGIAINHGRWDYGAFTVLFVAFVILAWRFALATRSKEADSGTSGALLENVGKLDVWLVLVLLLSLPITALFDATLIPEPAVHRWTMGRAAQVISILLIASYAPFVSGKRTEPELLRRSRFLLFAFLLLAAGTSAFRVDATPDIDVWTIQMRGAEVLLEGRNPYTWASVPDTDPETDFTVPYVYPPTPIYVGVLGRVLGGDIRYALLGTVLITGFALRFIARSGGHAQAQGGAVGGAPKPSNRSTTLLEDAPALFFWQTPPLFFILDRSWVDPLQVMLVSLGVAAHVAKRPMLAAIVCGIAISSKQSMFWLIPLSGFVLLGFGFQLRRWFVMGLSALVPVLPFVLWDFKSLKYANFEFMSKLGVRHDALSFTSFFDRVAPVSFPTQIGFILPVLIIAAACFRRPSDPIARSRTAILSFARAVLLVYFSFFFFNRWAFANYYFTLTGFAALMAAAAIGSRDLEASSSSKASA